MKCPKCEGCGKIANTDDQEPWTYWEELPPSAKVAVQMGLVHPVPCPACNGTGKIGAEE